MTSLKFYRHDFRRPCETPVEETIIMTKLELETKSTAGAQPKTPRHRSARAIAARAPTAPSRAAPSHRKAAPPLPPPAKTCATACSPVASSSPLNPPNALKPFAPPMSPSTAPSPPPNSPSLTPWPPDAGATCAPSVCKNANSILKSPASKLPLPCPALPCPAPPAWPGRCRRVVCPGPARCLANQCHSPRNYLRAPVQPRPPSTHLSHRKPPPASRNRCLVQ